MSNAFIASVLLFTAAADPDTAQLIIDHGFQRVLICPRAVSHDETREKSFSGDAGAMAKQLPWQVSQLLSGYDEFEVIPMSDAEHVLRNLSLQKISSVESLQILHEATQADALIVVHARNMRSLEEAEIRTEIIALPTAKTAGQAAVSYEQSLSDAAFAGNSFEVRRWSDGQLVPVGFKEQYRNDPRVNGVGENWERVQFAWLHSELEHPLVANDLPYGFTVEVDGQERPLIRHQGQFYVQLEENEEFRLRVWNAESQRVYLGLYVDGVNSIGGEFEHPLLVPTKRHWRLDAGYGIDRKVSVRGWTRADPVTGQLAVNRFRIVPQEQSLAAGQGVADRFGMITAVFYTNGADPSWKGPDDAPLRKSAGAIGVGAGAAELAATSFKPGNRGIILCAITIHYRTAEWIRSSLHETSQPARSPSVIKRAAVPPGRLPRQDVSTADDGEDQVKPRP